MVGRPRPPGVQRHDVQRRAVQVVVVEHGVGDPGPVRRHDGRHVVGAGVGDGARPGIVNVHHGEDGALLAVHTHHHAAVVHPHGAAALDHLHRHATFFRHHPHRAVVRVRQAGAVRRPHRVAVLPERGRGALGGQPGGHATGHGHGPHVAASTVQHVGHRGAVGRHLALPGPLRGGDRVEPPVRRRLHVRPPRVGDAAALVSPHPPLLPGLVAHVASLAYSPRLPERGAVSPRQNRVTIMQTVRMQPHPFQSSQIGVRPVFPDSRALFGTRRPG